MNLKEKISEDIKNAMRQREELKLSVLRMLSSSMHNREIEKRAKGAGEELTDEEVIAAVRTEVKKRRDAATEYEKGGRKGLAEKEAAESKILEAYLPAEVDDAAIESIVKDAIASLGNATAKDFGRVMGEAMKRLRGQASGERVSAAVKKLLQ